MSDAIKKCSDCMFCAPSEGYEDGDIGKWNFAKCRHTSALTLSSEQWHLGEEDLSHLYCSTMRRGDCGRTATLFEPRSAPK